MKISNRLKLIADMTINDYIIDVGCDHALLDIYLTQKGKKCVAIDISENVLKQAKNNISKYNLDIELIKTDGLKNVFIPKKSTVVISGMGAHTIIDILKYKYDIDELVISSHNDLYYIRKEIVKLGYYIDLEKSILDNKKYYVIIRFKKGKKKYSLKKYILGDLDKDYYNYLYNKNKKIISNIKKINIKKIKLIIINKWIKEKLQ